MTSVAQLAANLANALKSTGPKTDAGKKRSRVNAFRHGLTGQVVVMTPEDIEAWNAHRKVVSARYQPVGAYEKELVESISQDKWRLKRAKSIENCIFADGINDPEHGHPDNNPQVDAAFWQSRVWLAEGHNVQLLALYEQRITRSMERTIKELEKLQAERKAAHAQALEEEILLAQLAALENRSYEVVPQPGGFVFSTAEIVAIVERRHLVAKAKFFAKNGWNGQSKYEGPQMAFPKAA